jgi:hypothetical protein
VQGIVLEAQAGEAGALPYHVDGAHRAVTIVQAMQAECEFEAARPCVSPPEMQDDCTCIFHSQFPFLMAKVIVWGGTKLPLDHTLDVVRELFMEEHMAYVMRFGQLAQLDVFGGDEDMTPEEYFERSKDAFATVYADMPECWTPALRAFIQGSRVDEQLVSELRTEMDSALTQLANPEFNLNDLLGR